MPKIHPTATVDPEAKIADDVEIGPYCLVEPGVEIGRGCRLRNHVVIRRHTTLGRNNSVDAFVAFGGEPQDHKFDSSSVTSLRIGDDNIFREGVTISRATGEGNATVVGNKTYWMAYSHAGHNTIIEDEAVLVNGCAIAGHVRIGRKTILSAHVVVHQFCWVGEMVRSQGNAGISAHTPPYVMFARINQVVGLNVVGLRRAEELRDKDRRQIREAFALLYRSGLTPTKALEKMDRCTDWGPAADKFRQFVRRALAAQPPYNRPLCRFGSWAHRNY